MYKNLLNNTTILNEDILNIKNGVMTFFDGNTWTTISTNDVQEIESKENSTTNENTSDVNNIYVFKPDVTLKAGLCIPNSVSYYKTPKITITPESYIKLQADYNECESGSIEFYVIDGEKDGMSLYDAIPIRPENTAYINKERCWFNRDLRFLQDENDTALFFIDEKLDNNIKTLSDIDFSSGKNYAVSYKPSNMSGIIYSPKNNCISLLVILRSYDSTKKPPYVKSIKIIENRSD